MLYIPLFNEFEPEWELLFEISKSDIRTTRGTTITLFINEESEEFLEEYKTGITPDIGRKIITALNKAIDLGVSTDGELSKIRDRIKDWSGYNECNECKCLPNDSMHY